MEGSKPSFHSRAWIVYYFNRHVLSNRLVVHSLDREEKKNTYKDRKTHREKVKSSHEFTCDFSQ